MSFEEKKNVFQNQYQRILSVLQIISFDIDFKIHFDFLSDLGIRFNSDLPSEGTIC